MKCRFKVCPPSEDPITLGLFCQHNFVFFFKLISFFCFVERLIVVAEHYESNLSDFQKQGKAVR